MSNSRFKTLGIGTQAYVATIVGAGAITILQSFYDLAVHPIGWNWAILAILTLVSGSATVRLPSLPATISVSETFVFTSVLLFGSSAGTLTVALDALVISFWSYRKGHPTYKIIFNVCALPLTIWIAAHLFFLFPSIEPLVNTPRTDPVRIRALIGPLIAFTVLYFSLNSWIITFAIALERRLAAFTIWRNNFLWLSLNYFGGASVAALLVSYTRDLDYTYLAVIIPLLVILYFTFSMSMGRVEDANKHLTELNALYMSTIETLAMAIDAKDQITHGHIRRVQSYAVALAKETGVTEANLLKAVEAAALLHDMGKLAVPEYILSKPGPLTPAEFDKMKLHASVGADILSSINFPYPVVPIVRHHHENWDGTGYPDRLAGTNIPIGARILSVVDCFDALTSDRPYRPRLSDKEALQILMERRGTMYDPLIIDTFIRVRGRIVPPTATPSEYSSLMAITEASNSSPIDPPQANLLDEISGSAEEMLTLFDMARGLTSPLDLPSLGDVISKHLKRLVPCSLCVLFVYDTVSDELLCEYATGDNASLVSGLRITLGQRLSGWVGANRQTIRNSDPVLDFGEAARAMSPRFRSCLSTPIFADKGLDGVLTLYSTAKDAFTEEHQRVVEMVARQVGPGLRQAVLARAGNFETSQIAEIPTLEQIQQSGRVLDVSLVRPTSILVISVRDLATFRNRQGLQFETKLLQRVIDMLRRDLRAVDILFRQADQSFVALLPQVGRTTAEAIASRIRGGAQKRDGGSLPINLSVVVSTFEDGTDAAEVLIEKAVMMARQASSSILSEPPPGSVH